MNNYENLTFIVEDRWLWRKDDLNLHTFNVLNAENKLFYDILKPFLKNTKTMVQAGGNCGLKVATFAKYFEKVYTFEPDPLNFHCLVYNCPYDNVIKIQGCLGDNYNLVTLDNGSDHGARHVVNHDGSIPTFKIDDLNLRDCDLIQLDLEGYEYFGLLGALNTIKKFHPLICIEVAWHDRFHVTKKQLFDLLLSLGYEPVCEYVTDVIFKYSE